MAVVVAADQLLLFLGFMRGQNRMKVLVASTPLMGHLNPLLSVAAKLINENHEVLGLSANVMRRRIENVGAEFRPLPAGANLDLSMSNRDALFPEWKKIPSGPERLRFALEHVYIDAMPAQYEGLRQVLREFPADVIIGDNFFFGALPLLLGTRSNRPAIVLCGTMLLHCHRDDDAPHFAGLAPATNDVQLKEYAAISKEHGERIYKPVNRYLNATLSRLGVGPLDTDLLHALVTLPEAYLQLTVPSFEFPRQNLPRSVHFVGTPPIIPGQAPLPPWADELDGSRKAVLVTQGTLSNFDFGQLILPTLTALENETDMLVIVTTGGRPLSAFPNSIPVNARLATYLPFEWLLPKVNVFVTNGGYGSVNQALSFGIPLVTAGKTEDKADVNARVAWSGVGIDLATNNPTPQELRVAVRTVLDSTNYSLRARSMGNEFNRIDTLSEVTRILQKVSVRTA